MAAKKKFKKKKTEYNHNLQLLMLLIKNILRSAF